MRQLRGIAGSERAARSGEHDAAHRRLRADDVEVSEVRRFLADLAALAEHRVSIPILGRAESLNLSTAAAVCLYASARAGRW